MCIQKHTDEFPAVIWVSDCEKNPNVLFSVLSQSGPPSFWLLCIYTDGIRLPTGNCFEKERKTEISHISLMRKRDGNMP